jgi:mannosyl-oligosaccharide alpha-1,2-mannosidase
MGMKDEFDKGAEFVLKELDFDKEPSIVSLFETNIRLLGGLLSSYALTKDVRFKEKAIDLGDRFMRNFESRVFPNNNLQLKNLPVTGHRQFQPSSLGRAYVSTSLAQVGTFSLEFGYLSHISGNPIYKQKALAIIEELETMQTKLPGLYPSHIVSGKVVQTFDSTSTFRISLLISCSVFPGW